MCLHLHFASKPITLVGFQRQLCLSYFLLLLLQCLAKIIVFFILVFVLQINEAVLFVKHVLLAPFGVEEVLAAE